MVRPCVARGFRRSGGEIVLRQCIWSPIEAAASGHHAHPPGCSYGAPIAIVSSFPGEAARANYVRELRWPNGFVCPIAADTRDGRRASGRCCEAAGPGAADLDHGGNRDARGQAASQVLVLGRIPRRLPFQRDVRAAAEEAAPDGASTTGKALFHPRFRKLPMAPGIRCRTSFLSLEHIQQRSK
jgi:hypothetical protein